MFLRAVICTLTTSKMSHLVHFKFQHRSWVGDGSRGFPNDIALLELATPADLSSQYIDTIEMVNANDGDFAGQNCKIIGWGNTRKQEKEDDFHPSVDHCPLTIGLMSITSRT